MLALLVLSSFGYGQTARFGVEECMAYAIENEANSINATLDEEIAALSVKETIGIGLPQISGSVNVQHNPDLPRFFSQYDPNSGFGITQEQAQSLGIQQGDVFGAQNFFQLQSNGDMNLSVNQLIFNGSYIVGLQAAKTYKKLAAKQKDYTQSEIKAAVAKAYFNVLINDERLKLYESNIDRLQKLYEETEALNENGFVEKIEVDRLKVTLNNANTQRNNYENLADLSMKLLKFQMNYPLDKPLELEGSISDFVDGEVQNIPQEYDLANRSDYQTMITNKEFQELNLKNMYAGGLPVIQAFGTFGANTQSTSFGGLFKQESSFSGNSQVGPDRWFSYSAIGLRLNWSLFTGLQRNYQIQQQKVEIKKLENSLSQFETQVRIEVEQQGILLKNANENLAIQKENMELAQNIFNISEIKYKEGVGSSLEIVNADNELKQAQTNFFNALFDAVIAKIDLTRAIGARD
ncbi:MAG: TolC family protein [Ekhidna sp.]|nr:TolC family protein [Ekhidna sp.]